MPRVRQDLGSGDVRLGALTYPSPDDFEPLGDEHDQVLDTAEDRPSHDTLPPLSDPAADHFDPEVKERRADVEEKHRRVVEFLDRRRLDALVLGRSDSIAWFTGGADLNQGLHSERASAMLYINAKSRAVITDNVQTARVFEEELGGLGFQLKERPWRDDLTGVVDQLGHRRKLATDGTLLGRHDDGEALRRLRYPMTRRERQVLRELGRTLTLAVEATSRNFQPGETEADVAGHLAHRLLREGITPLDLRVAGDDRLARYREPKFKAAPIQRRATITAVGRRHGLCASVTRTVTFGPSDPGFRGAHGLAAMVDATLVYFSRPGESIAEVYRRARRIYEKFDRPDEWTLAYQGYQIGYAPREALLHPDDPEPLAADTALCWCPSVGPARVEDTVVIDARGFEVVTEAQRWPKLEVMVKGFAIARPGILER